MKNIWKTYMAGGVLVLITMAGCTHTVKIEPSDKPIVININLNIQQEIRVRLDKDIEDILADNPDVF